MSSQLICVIWYDTVITPPSELGREEKVSTMATLKQEMNCSMSRVAWATAPMPVWNSDRLISLPVGRSQGDVIWWCRGLESKDCRVALLAPVPLATQMLVSQLILYFSLPQSFPCWFSFLSTQFWGRSYTCIQSVWINLDTDIWVARGTGARRALAWHHNLWDLMLGASCGLEWSEIVLTEQRNPEET